MDSVIVMPRHAESAHTFLESRKPRVVFVQPEPCWVIDNYRVKRWYYRSAPEVGDRVLYLQDGLSTRVQSVKFFSLFFEDGTAMRRPYVGRRMGAWVLPRLQNMIPTSTAIATRWKLGRQEPRTSKLRPDAATLYV